MAINNNQIAGKSNQYENLRYKLECELNSRKNSYLKWEVLNEDANYYICWEITISNRVFTGAYITNYQKIHYGIDTQKVILESVANDLAQKLLNIGGV